VPAGEDAGNGERMGEVGVAADAELALVRLGREDEGGGDALDVLWLEVGAEQFLQFLELKALLALIELGGLRSGRGCGGMHGSPSSPGES
jgi:hypothetical protein